MCVTNNRILDIMVHKCVLTNDQKFNNKEKKKKFLQLNFKTRFIFFLFALAPSPLPHPPPHLGNNFYKDGLHCIKI